MKNKRQLFGLVAYLLISVAPGRTVADPGAKQDLVSQFAQLAVRDQSGRVESFRLPSLAEIDSLVDLIAGDDLLVRNFIEESTNSGVPLREESKVALIFLPLITSFTEVSNQKLRDLATRDFLKDPSVLNANFLGVFADLNSIKNIQEAGRSEFTRNPSLRVLIDEVYRVRTAKLKHSFYPIISPNSTIEEIEVKKLALCFQSETSNEFSGWHTRVQALGSNQIDFCIEMLGKGEPAATVGLLKVLQYYGMDGRLRRGQIDNLFAWAIENANYSHPIVREVITSAVTATGDDGARSVLRVFANDSNYDVRLGAYFGLKMLGETDLPEIRESRRSKVLNNIGDRGQQAVNRLYANEIVKSEKTDDKFSGAIVDDQNDLVLFWIFLVIMALIFAFIVRRKRRN